MAITATTGMTMYSFKDVTVSLSHPLAGEFILFGQMGIGQIGIEMGTEQTVIDIAGDGAAMVSAIPGDNGKVTIEAQQTSPTHKWLLAWYNVVNTLKNQGDVSNWATMAILINSLLDGSQHMIRNAAPQMVPQKTYAKQGGNVTWTLLSPSITNL
jgi:hypothetical protein